MCVRNTLRVGVRGRAGSSSQVEAAVRWKLRELGVFSRCSFYRHIFPRLHLVTNPTEFWLAWSAFLCTGVLPVQRSRWLCKRVMLRLFNCAGSQSTITSLTNTGLDNSPWAAAQFETSVQLTLQPPHTTAIWSVFANMLFCSRFSKRYCVCLFWGGFWDYRRWLAEAEVLLKYY